MKTVEDGTVVGDAHRHKLPAPLAVRLGAVVECECKDRFVNVPKGLIGAGWEPAPAIKTEEEVQEEKEPEVPNDTTSEETSDGTTSATESE